jgi:hypothetical protein
MAAPPHAKRATLAAVPPTDVGAMRSRSDATDHQRPLVLALRSPLSAPALAASGLEALSGRSLRVSSRVREIRGAQGERQTCPCHLGRRPLKLAERVDQAAQGREGQLATLLDGAADPAHGRALGSPIAVARHQHAQPERLFQANATAIASRGLCLR